MKNTRRLLTTIITFALASLYTQFVQTSQIERTPAAIPPRQIELEIDKVVPVKPADQGIVSQETVTMVMPTDIQQTNDSNIVRNKIVDHNIQNLMQGKFMKNSPIVQSAQKVQEAMKPSVSFGEEGGVQHNVNLEVQPTQNIAKLNYTGFVDTNLTYSASEDHDVEVSMSERLSQKARLSIEHQSKDDLSMLKLNLDW